MNTKSQLLTGTILLNKYKVEEAIGEGGFGSVYKATDILLKRTLALKTLLRNKNTIHTREDEEVFEEFLDRFQREAEVSSFFTANPNIITVYGVEQDDRQNYYLLLEYLDGGSVDQLISENENKHLSVAQTCSIALDLCHALVDIHNHPADIVHRDIKPGNVLLRAKGSAVLADFGIAQVGHDSHRTVMREGGSRMMRHPGSPPYRSPEQTNGVDYLTPASDLYSLGLVIYEMLTGKMYAKYHPKYAPSRLNKDVPTWLDNIVVKLLQPKIEDRYQQAEELRAAFQAGLNGTSGSQVGSIPVSKGYTNGLNPKTSDAAERSRQVSDLAEEERQRQREAADKVRKEREAEDREREWGELEKKWLEEMADQDRLRKEQLIAEAKERAEREETERIRLAREIEEANQRQQNLVKQVTELTAQLSYSELKMDWNGVLEAGRKILALMPDHPPTLNRLQVAYKGNARALYNQGKFDQAIKNLNLALEMDLDDADVYYERGLNYYHKGEYDRALLDLNRAIELEPNPASYYYARAMAYHHKQNYHGSITDYTRAISREPANASFYYHRGLSYDWRGANFYNKDDQELAFADFDRAVQLDPNNPLYFYHRAMSFRKKGDIRRTIMDLDRTIQLDGSRADYYYQRGLSLTQNKAFDAAISDFNRAIELDKNQSNYYYWRGLTYKAKRDRKTAKRDLQIAVDMGHPKARADLAAL